MLHRRVLSAAVILLSTGPAFSQVTRFEKAGNLESKNPLGCVPLEQVTSQHTPADLYHGISACLEEQDYASAVRLFAIARAYGGFDMMRVRDESAHGAMEVLNVAVLGGLSTEAQQNFTAALNTEFRPASERLAHQCAVISGIGRPTYHPTYMIQHGLDAAVTRDGDSLVADFDAASAWNQVMESVLECDVDTLPVHSASAPAATADPGFATLFGVSDSHEYLLQAVPTGFEVGFQVERDGMYMVELVPAGETVEAWSEMVTTQIFFGSEGGPADFRDRIATSWISSCEGAEYQAIADGLENGYEFAVWALACPQNVQTGAPEITLFKAIRGAEGFYLVHKAFRYRPEAEELQDWSGYLYGVMVCDPRVPERACQG